MVWGVVCVWCADVENASFSDVPLMGRMFIYGSSSIVGSESGIGGHG